MHDRCCQESQTNTHTSQERAWDSNHHLFKRGRDTYYGQFSAARNPADSAAITLGNSTRLWSAMSS